MSETGRNPQFRWQSNDIFDIDALSVAVAYCDLGVTDKQAANALRRGRVPERLGWQVFTTWTNWQTSCGTESVTPWQDNARLGERAAMYLGRSGLAASVSRFRQRATPQAHPAASPTMEDVGACSTRLLAPSTGRRSPGVDVVRVEPVM